MKVNTLEKHTSIITKTIALISVIYGLIRGIVSIDSFTYFTILSNIFIAIMLFIFLGIDVKCIIQKKERNVPNILYTTKFLATVSIALTFFVFMFILAPTFGGDFISAYTGADYSSFCLHFLTPLLAMIDFCIFDYDFKSSNKHAIYAIIPPLIYVAFIIIIGQCGFRWNDMIAPYNFLNYTAPTGWFGFNLEQLGPNSLGIGVTYIILILLVIFTILGRIFLAIKNKRTKCVYSKYDLRIKKY